MLRVHEVAVSPSVACALVVLTALRLPEICDRRVLSDDDLASVVPTIEPAHGRLSLIFSLVLNVNIANHVLADVISYHYLVELPEASKLHEYLFIEVFEVVHSLNQVLLRHIKPICEGHSCWRIVVEMRQNHCLGYWRLIVNASAGLSMTTSANLEVEGAIDLVFLCTEDLRKSLCHLLII